MTDAVREIRERWKIGIAGEPPILTKAREDIARLLVEVERVEEILAMARVHAGELRNALMGLKRHGEDCWCDTVFSKKMRHVPQCQAVRALLAAESPTP